MQIHQFQLLKHSTFPFELLVLSSLKESLSNNPLSDLKDPFSYGNEFLN